DLVDVPERDLLARQPVVFLERARERPERAGYLPLGRERDRRRALEIGQAARRQLEPVDQRRGRRERRRALERLARQTDGGAEQEEQLGMRKIASRDPP